MFLGTFTLKIPLIDFSTAKTTESLGMKTEIPSDQSSESESSEASNNQSGKSSGKEIADNQGTYAMIEEIGNCVVMPEFPNAYETGTPHEATPLSDKDVEEMLKCAKRNFFSRCAKRNYKHRNYDRVGRGPERCFRVRCQLLCGIEG